ELVGPICESSDVVGRDRCLPPLEVGDVVAIRDAGAYGSAMASNYNRHPLPAEVLVDGGSWRGIRGRQTLEDMVSLEGGVVDRTHRCVRRPGSERQADPGRAAARPSETGRPQAPPRLVPRLRHVDRRGDRASASG